jgi:hypothetical protein
VGYYEGNVAVFLNAGTSAAAAYQVTATDVLGTAGDDEKKHAVPFLRDFDADGTRGLI